MTENRCGRFRVLPAFSPPCFELWRQSTSKIAATGASGRRVGFDRQDLVSFANPASLEKGRDAAQGALMWLKSILYPALSSRLSRPGIAAWEANAIDASRYLDKRESG
jgi:hypothetical protein